MIPRPLDRFYSSRISDQLKVFLHDETIGGKLILGATLLSLLVVNSLLYDLFTDFWHIRFSIGFSDQSLALDLRHWLNEGLMAFFFLVVGLEIKREWVKGELRDRKAALLPIGTAIGGMILPACLYLLFNFDSSTIKGWGIPIATDIAFAVGILVLLGDRIPNALKVFLLTLAIVDDIGAIIVIALFYAEIIHYGYLAASIVLLLALFALRKQLVDRAWLIISAALLLWLTVHLSGIHASIVGVAVGLLAPTTSYRNKQSIAEKAEHFFLPLTTFFILPLFAFANAGFVLSVEALSYNPSVTWGIVIGLVAGKAAGIVGASWIMTKLRVASIPPGLNLKHIAGVGFIAGIGFTVSIFITELAFASDPHLIDAAKVGIFIASATSAFLGAAVLLKSTSKSR